jgi:CSLREA domain-containing protein
VSHVAPIPRALLAPVVSLLLALSLIGTLPTPVRGATIDVTTTSDELDILPATGSGCSLREAVVAANTNAAVGGCPAGDAETTVDRINVPAGTYTLSIAPSGETAATTDAAVTGDLDITGSLNIVGAGARSTIVDAGGIARVFHIVSGTVGIADLTIQNGNQQGAPGGDGGGLYIRVSTVQLFEVTITGNTVQCDGGAIYNIRGSALAIVGSTISGNSATGSCTSNEGGGIYNDFQSSTIITNSTISGNSAANGGGGVFNEGSFSSTNSTIADNAAPTGGGIWRVSDIFSGTVTLKNTIVADQQSGADCSGTIVSAGNNLSSDSTCFTSGGSDLVNTDPQLGVLADNGGPTDTHALATDSPAIDAGNNIGCPATDQRGVARPIDGDGDGTAVCDIGAYEAAAPPPPDASINDVSVTEGNSGTVDAVFTVTLSAASSGTVTMAYATANGSATTPADYQAAAGTVTFAPGDTSETITVKVVGDTLDEPNETFVVNLSDPDGATLADAQGTGTILDDDGAPAPVTPTPSPTPSQQVLADTTVAASRSSEAWIGFAMAVLLLTGVAFSAVRLTRRGRIGDRR